MKIRLTQIDGKLPNLALMKLSHYYKSNGHEVVFKRSIVKDIFEPDYDIVFGSTIFTTSQKKIDLMKSQFPTAIIKGTGTEDYSTVEDFIGVNEYEFYDYTIYPEFDHSIGFTQRGCRLRCSFCVVPKKEGKVRSMNTLLQIWRGTHDEKFGGGDHHEKKLHLLDNDFFGQSNWRERCQEAIEHDFEICLNQGINIRLIDQEGANMLKLVKYRDDQFKTPRIYTAWDNKKDENIFSRGVGYMLNAGIKPKHILVYFLIGYWKDETFEDIWYRFDRIRSMGMLPYPMCFDPNNLYLKKFQRWVIRRYYQFIDWEMFSTQTEKDYYEMKNKYKTEELF